MVPMSREPFQSKGQVTAFGYSHKKRHNTVWASLDFGGNIYLIWACYSDALTKQPEKLLVLGRDLNRSGLP